MAVILPTKTVKPTKDAPDIMLLISPPKTGKTEAAAALTRLCESAILLDCEPREGSKYTEARKLVIDSLIQLKEVCDAIEQAGKPYQYVVIDSITAIQDWMIDYCIEKCKKTNDPDYLKTKNLFRMNRGKGWVMLREEFGRLLNRLARLGQHVIFIGHVKDKEIFENVELSETSATLRERKITKVSANILDLFGQTRGNVVGLVDLAGVLTRSNKVDNEGIAVLDKGKFVKTWYLSFMTDEISSGGRIPRLADKMFEFDVIRDPMCWSIIFPALAKEKQSE